MTTDIQERCDRLDLMIEEGRVVRKDWGDGKEQACLLLALAPECKVGEDGGVPVRCPGHVLPGWLAYMTPWIDDAPSPLSWGFLIREFSALVRRSGALTPSAWRKLGYTARSIAVREAMLHTFHPDTRAACQAVAHLCERAAAGDEPGAGEWTAARHAVRATVGAGRPNRSALVFEWGPRGQRYVARAARAATYNLVSAEFSAASWAGCSTRGHAAADRIIHRLFDEWRKAIKASGSSPESHPWLP